MTGDDRRLTLIFVSCAASEKWDWTGKHKGDYRNSKIEGVAANDHSCDHCNENSGNILALTH